MRVSVFENLDPPLERTRQHAGCKFSHGLPRAGISMAVARRIRTNPLALAAILVAASVAQAQAGGGSLAGKLTDLYSAPLAGATLILRNEATGAQLHTTTRKNGTYRFAGLPAGNYTLEAESDHLGRGHLDGIVVIANHEERLQTAMQLDLPAPMPIQSAALPLQATAPTVHRTPKEPAAVAAAASVADRELAATTVAATAEPASQLASILRRLAEPVIDTQDPGVQTAALPTLPLLELTLAERRLPQAEPPAPEVGPPNGTGNASSGASSAQPQTADQATGKNPSPRANQEIAEAKPEAASPAMDVLDDAMLGSLRLGPLGLELYGLASPVSGSPGREMLGTTGLATIVTAGHMMEAAIEVSRIRPRETPGGRQDADPVTPVVTTVVTADQLQALPVTGRRWQDFVLDSPSAGTAAGGGSQTSPRGAGQEPVESTIDGASTRLAFGPAGGTGSAETGTAEPVSISQPWAGGRGSVIAEAAIRRVQTTAGNVEAEGDRAAGGRMSVETERGENGLHGQAFFFDRQNTWGAQNPFTKWITETAPATETTVPVFTPQPYTPPDHETTWGFGMGSQIRRDKLFWFAAVDGYHRNDPAVSTVKTPSEFFAQPTNDQMQVLSAQLGLTSNNPVAAGLAAYSSMLETLDGLLGPVPRAAAQWVGFSRIDWQAAERHRFSLEGIGATWNSPGGGLTRVSETYGSNSFGSIQASEEWLLGRWEAFLTPNLLAETQGSFGHTDQSAKPETPSAFEKTLLSPSVWGQLPQIVVDNRYGFTIGNPSRFGNGSYPDERAYQGQEIIDWARGTVLVKAGFDLSHNFDSTSLLRNQTGTYTYSSVENFASDALAFSNFGVSGELNPYFQHNCDETGKVWRDSTGTLHGLGYLPCYSYYSQTMGPTDWHLSTNDWAGYSTAQWQPKKLLVVSAGLRWEREQLPPPIAALINPNLPLTETLPNLGNNWGPRVSLAVGDGEGRKLRWPVLRLGYGMYFGRVENSTAELALTQTGSLNGDLNFFLRPTDDLPNNVGGAPPFPYVLQGEPGSVVKPGVVEFASRFHNPEIHQAVAAVEETLPGLVQVTASTVLSLGRRLPISIDTNFDPAFNPQTITYKVVDSTGLGPIKTPQVTVPFYASWPSATAATGFAGRLNPDYQQTSQIESRANSTYEAEILKVSHYGRHGLSLHAHYTLAHAMDWNPNESTAVAGSDLLDPANFSQEYGTSNLDVRHSGSATLIYQAPWKLHEMAGRLANGWMMSWVTQFRSGLPYTMRTSGSLAEEFERTTNGTALIEALGPGMNGSGGDNRVYGVGRNTYRYPSTWKADMRLGKSFDLPQTRKLELMLESFNLFNHQNVTELETTGYSIESGTSSGGLPTLNFLNGVKANTTAFGQPLNINATDFYRERQLQVGLRLRY